MCRECFSDFLNLSGGLWQGQKDPPAWTRNYQQQQRMMQRALAGSSSNDLLALPAPGDDETGALSAVLYRLVCGSLVNRKLRFHNC